MASRVVASWGNVIRAAHVVHELHSRYDPFPTPPEGRTVLPFGNGRSYGDSCLNVGGALAQTRGLDRFIHFDRQTGVLACEAGVLLADILRVAVPAGWFLPVVPGTCYVTVGGAIANDVHGKNHHHAGTFGRHVRRLELLRSNGERFVCSPDENSSWFAATVGGLGLTGIVTWAELQLRPIAGPWVEVETIRFDNLESFSSLSAEAERECEYTVAWIDCLGRGKHLGRGILQRANHTPEKDPSPPGRSAGKVAVPFPLPWSLVNGVSLRAFNTVHYHRHSSQLQRKRDYFQTFFFPLDGILHWNRLYGPAGFYQYQCVVPTSAAHEATAQLLDTIAQSGLGSFLAVLKRFGPLTSPGMLSFPRAGVTLALDFPNKGARLEKLFDSLDGIVSSAGGALYPAKDGRMPPALFRSGYPRWREFSQYIDPACSSSFWRRTTENA
jgi:FAD/FMN-containing dehydrogenase